MKKKSLQTKLFEPELFFVEFQLEGRELQRTRIMSFEECRDFVDFLDVFAFNYSNLNICPNEDNN